jgi:hypothetical protein
MHYQEWGYNFLTQAFSMVVPLWIHEITNSYAVDEAAQRLLQELAVTSPNASGYSLSQCHIKYKKKIWVGANSASQTKIINDFHSSGVGGALWHPSNISESEQIVYLERHHTTCGLICTIVQPLSACKA